METFEKGFSSQTEKNKQTNKQTKNTFFYLERALITGIIEPL